MNGPYKVTNSLLCVWGWVGALPRDQMSTSGPYGNLEMTSGLIQYGVPTKDFRFGSSGET